MEKSCSVESIEKECSAVSGVDLGSVGVGTGVDFGLGGSASTCSSVLGIGFSQKKSRSRASSHNDLDALDLANVEEGEAGETFLSHKPSEKNVAGIAASYCKVAVKPKSKDKLDSEVCEIGGESQAKEFGGAGERVSVASTVEVDNVQSDDELDDYGEGECLRHPRPVAVVGAQLPATSAGPAECSRDEDIVDLGHDEEDELDIEGDELADSSESSRSRANRKRTGASDIGNGRNQKKTARPTATVEPANTRIEYKDMSTWTVEDDVLNSPFDSSTAESSPDLSHSHFRRGYAREMDGYIARKLHDPIDFDEFEDDDGASAGISRQQRHSHPPPQHHHRPLPALALPLPPFSVSSQLQSRETRLYENVPRTQSSNLGFELSSLQQQQQNLQQHLRPLHASAEHLLLHQSNSNSASAAAASYFLDSATNKFPQQFAQQLQQLTPSRQCAGGTGKHQHRAVTASNSAAGDFLNVSDFLGGNNSNSGSCSAGAGGVGGAGGNGGGGGPPSRSSWVDSGRESLSFDGDPGSNSNHSNSSKTAAQASSSSATGNSNGANSRQQQLQQGIASIFRNENLDPLLNCNYSVSPAHSYSSYSKGCAGAGGGSDDNNANYLQSSNRKSMGSRRERLVRQKYAIEDHNSFGGVGSGVNSGNGGQIFNSYLAVPSPSHNTNQHQHQQHHRGLSALGSNSLAVAASPISLHRHPNSQQQRLQENKRCRGLIPGCESPYGTTDLDTGNEWLNPNSAVLSTSSSAAVNANKLLNLSKKYRENRFAGHHGISGGGGGRSGGGGHGSNSSSTSYYRQLTSFDYGELPSHQMFPKRHLLGGRQFSQPYNSNSAGGLGASNIFNNNNMNLNNTVAGAVGPSSHSPYLSSSHSAHHGLLLPHLPQGGGNGTGTATGAGTSASQSHQQHGLAVPGQGQQNQNGVVVQQQQQHRSFPAGILSVAPRSCSMGDLTSSGIRNGANGGNNGGGAGNSSNGGKLGTAIGNEGHGHGLGSNTSGAITNGLSSTVPLVTSLPLPPATSVTYEFSLAPVSGTLAPGWHLTAVQRGLATAVPLAAVVARRRIPRPRPLRPRFGFTDKNEARRAKWTIVITALALLAMSMLLVGITLRLAPLIDDLVRKENEELIRRNVIQQTQLNSSVNNATNSDHNNNNTQQSSSPSTGNNNVRGFTASSIVSSDLFLDVNNNPASVDKGSLLVASASAPPPPQPTPTTAVTMPMQSSSSSADKPSPPTGFPPAAVQINADSNKKNSRGTKMTTSVISKHVSPSGKRLAAMIAVPVPVPEKRHTPAAAHAPEESQPQEQMIVRGQEESR